MSEYINNNQSILSDNKSSSEIKLFRRSLYGIVTFHCKLYERITQVNIQEIRMSNIILISHAIMKIKNLLIEDVSPGAEKHLKSIKNSKQHSM